jgi:hypothetical protein
MSRSSNHQVHHNLDFPALLLLCLFLLLFLRDHFFLMDIIIGIITI